MSFPGRSGNCFADRGNAALDMMGVLGSCFAAAMMLSASQSCSEMSIWSPEGDVAELEVEHLHGEAGL